MHRLLGSSRLISVHLPKWISSLLVQIALPRVFSPRQISHFPKFLVCVTPRVSLSSSRGSRRLSCQCCSCICSSCLSRPRHLVALTCAPHIHDCAISICASIWQVDHHVDCLRVCPPTRTSPIENAPQGLQRRVRSLFTHPRHTPPSNDF